MRCLLLCDDGNPSGVAALAAARGLGVEAQSFYQPELLDSPEATLAEHRRLLEGIAPLSMHGPFADLCPGGMDPLVRQVARRRIAQALPIAAELGAAHLVLHHGYVPHTSAPAKWVARSTAFWRDVLATVPPGLQLHIENLFEERPDLLLELVQNVGDPRLGICLDIGHAHALSRTPVVTWVVALGPALTYVHVHDNHGVHDDHLPLGQGSLPLREVLAALETHAPDATWGLEADAIPSLAWLQENGYLSA